MATFEGYTLDVAKGVVFGSRVGMADLASAVRDAAQEMSAYSDLGHMRLRT